MKRECVIWPVHFKPTYEFNKFITSLGYNHIPYKALSQINFDPRVIHYVKEHSDWNAWGYVDFAMRGQPSDKFVIGFCGAAYILEVDDDKTWIIRWRQCGVPFIRYITLHHTSYGQVYWECLNE